MSINVTYIPSTLKFNYGYINYLPNGSKVIGVQADPFQEAE